MPIIDTSYGIISEDADLFYIAKTIRSIMEPMFHEKYDRISKDMLAEISSLPEKSTWADTSLNGSARELEKYRIDLDIYDEMSQNHRSMTLAGNFDNPFYDVYLLPNGQGGNPLVLVSSDNREDYVQAVLSNSSFSEYSFVPGISLDEEVSPKELSQREAAWSVITDKHPSEIGYSFSQPSRMQCSLRAMGY